MRKISVLILALLVLVILPTWAVAGPILEPGQFANKVVIIWDIKTQKVELVVNGTTGEPYHDVEAWDVALEPVKPLDEGCKILLHWKKPASPGHWCVINGRMYWCP